MKNGIFIYIRHIFNWVKNMKKIIEKVLNVDKKTFYFLAIISIIGIITGALFMTVLSTGDKEIVSNSLKDYITNIGSIKYNFKEFINNFILNILYASIIWLLGISVIGLPIVIITIFFKSFLISFTVSSFIINYKFKGLIYSLIYIFPHMIINLIIYLYLGIYSIKLSINLIKAICSKKNINFKNSMISYLKLFIISLFLIIFTTLYETYLVPLILKKIISMI